MPGDDQNALRVAVEASVDPAWTNDFLLRRLRTSNVLAGRFIRAAGGVVSLAAERFVETLRWRREQGIDCLLDTPQPALAAVAKDIHEGFPHGVDGEGRPVFYHVLADLNLDALLHNHSPDACVRHAIYWMEFRSRFLLEDRRGGGQFVSVVDLKGLGMAHLLHAPFMRSLRALFLLSQRHYPETLHRVLVVNAGRLFRLGWAMLRPVLDPTTQAKVVICQNPGEVPKRLGVAPDVCPPTYGGRCSCGCRGEREWSCYRRVVANGLLALGGETVVRSDVQAIFLDRRLNSRPTLPILDPAVFLANNKA